jgi:hypothetical protein
MERKFRVTSDDWVFQEFWVPHKMFLKFFLRRAKKMQKVDSNEVNSENQRKTIENSKSDWKTTRRSGMSPILTPFSHRNDIPSVSPWKLAGNFG